MRRFSLLLCLLAIAMLGWIIGPAEATTATVQKDAGVSKTHLALDATNTGSKDISVASGTRTADEASITHELPSSAIAASRHSTATIPYQPNHSRAIPSHCDRCRPGDRKSPHCRGAVLIGLDEPICNVA